MNQITLEDQKYMILNQVTLVNEKVRDIRTQLKFPQNHKEDPTWRARANDKIKHLQNDRDALLIKVGEIKKKIKSVNREENTITKEMSLFYREFYGVVVDLFPDKIDTLEEQTRMNITTLISESRHRVNG